jgi:hypothetical protein
VFVWDQFSLPTSTKTTIATVKFRSK